MKKIFSVTIILLSVLTWVFTSTSALAASIQQATPIPSSTEVQSNGAAFPWLGVLLLAAALGVIIWLKSRPGVKNEVTAVGCLPVIDEEAIARQKAKQDAAETNSQTE